MKHRPLKTPVASSPDVKGTDEYKVMPIEDALRELGSVLEGLSEAEVEKRLKTYGRNEVAARKKKRHPRVPVPVLGTDAVAAGAGDRAHRFPGT